jgi:hypothetical protein
VERVTPRLHPVLIGAIGVAVLTLGWLAGLTG